MSKKKNKPRGAEFKIFDELEDFQNERNAKQVRTTAVNMEVPDESQKENRSPTPDLPQLEEFSEPQNLAVPLDHSSPELPQLEEPSEQQDSTTPLEAPAPQEDTPIDNPAPIFPMAPESEWTEHVAVWELLTELNSAKHEGDNKENQSLSTQPFVLDYRIVDPETEHDKINIVGALWYTLAVAKSMGFEGFVQTSPEKCYFDQYKEIQAAFASEWKVADVPVPQLYLFDAWHGGLVIGRLWRLRLRSLIIWCLHSRKERRFDDIGIGRRFGVVCWFGEAFRMNSTKALMGCMSLGLSYLLGLKSCSWQSCG